MVTEDSYATFQIHPQLKIGKIELKMSEVKEETSITICNGKQCASVNFSAKEFFDILFNHYTRHLGDLQPKV